MVSKYMGMGVAIRLVLGGGAGVAMNNIAAGMGAGLVLGVAIGTAFFKWNEKDEEKE